MPSQDPNKQLVKALLRKRDALTAQQAALRRTQRELLLELHVGAKLCEGLAFLQNCIMQHQQGSDDSISPCDHGMALSHLAADMLEEQAAALLEQLPRLQDSDGSCTNGCSDSDGGAGAGASALRGLEQLVMAEFEQEQQTVAPPHDPLAYIRRLFSLPVQPGEAIFKTAEELAGLHKHVVAEAGLLLHGLECTTAPERRQQLVEQLQGLWDRYFHACLHTTLCDGHMYELHCLFHINQLTMQPDVEGACLQGSRAGQLLQQLGLTQQQRDLIGAGMRLILRQLERIYAEQAQLQALPQEHGATTSSSSSSSTTTSPEARRARLADEQQRAAQLHRLQLKGAWMRLLGSSWVVGNLTIIQVTKGEAASWPYSVRWLLVGMGGTQRDVNSQAAVAGRLDPHSWQGPPGAPANS